MMIVSIVSMAIILTVVILYLQGNRRYKDKLAYKKQGRGALMPLGFLVLHLVGYTYGHGYDRKITSKFIGLYGRREAKSRYEHYLAEKVGLSVVIIGVFALITLVTSINGFINREMIQDGGFQRSEENRYATVEMEVNNGRQSYKTEVDIVIPKRDETKEAIEAKLSGVASLIKDAIDNMEAITKDVKLINSHQGVEIKWSTSDEGLMDEKGHVYNEELTADGVTLTLRATLLYKDATKKVEGQIRILPPIIVPPTLEEVTREVVKQIEEGDYNEGQRLQLPTGYEPENKSGFYRINWQSGKLASGIKILLLGLVIASLLFYLGDEDLKKKQKSKNLYMQLRFPDMIAKFTLLINAGMTVYNAWTKVCEDYMAQKEETGKIDPLYEEMLMALSEIKGGVSETLAYDQMSMRIQVKEVKKFASTLSGSIKRGNSDLLDRLSAMSTDAWETRVTAAKRLGEEAATKLLFPMMIMLLVVVGIIVYPAMQTLQM